MCVVSMIMDHYWDKWKPDPVPYPTVPSPFGLMYPIQPTPKLPTQEEIDEFYKLLQRAREYDKKNNEPDCELEEKKLRLKKLADELGISISFD